MQRARDEGTLELLLAQPLSPGAWFMLFAFGRFIYKLYIFGHHLDPEAPVKVAPFTPAVIDTKHIANFTETSAPGLARSSSVLGDLLRPGRPLSLLGRDAIIVDDAVTTADTLRAAARSLRSQAPRSLVLAVPVGDRTLVEELHADYDRVVCLLTEPMLSAVGARYRDFPPVSEAEVAGLLAAARRDGDARNAIAGFRRGADSA